MKLNPEDLVVSSFKTTGSSLSSLPTKTVIEIETVGPISYEPTPMTYCYWCPPKTIDTIVVAPVDR